MYYSLVNSSRQTKNDLKKKISLKHVVREMSDRGNVRSGKCLSGEVPSRGSVLRGFVWSGNCPFGEMSVGKESVGEPSSRGTVRIPFVSDVDKVLNYPNNLMVGSNMKNSTCKLVMVLALTTVSRSSELTHLDIRYTIFYFNKSYLSYETRR